MLRVSVLNDLSHLLELSKAEGIRVLQKSTEVKVWVVQDHRHMRFLQLFRQS